MPARLPSLDRRKANALLAGAFVLFFGVLALGIGLEFGTPSFDPWLSRIAAEGRASSEVWIALSWIGQGRVVALVALLAAIALALCGLRRDALILVAVLAAQMATNPLLKHLYARIRPDLYQHLDRVTDLSYPSGHSAQNACLYVLLAFLVHRPIALVGIPLAILVGLSRVVLGVHWPTDVLGGWMEGAGFALIGAYAQQRLATSQNS